MGGLMNAEISAFKILNRLEWSSLVLILGLLIGARVLASATGWLISHLGERAPGRWRLTVLKSRPIVRLLIAVGTVLIIIPILVPPTFENAIALLAAFGLVFAFALKDYGSSLVAGLVTILEGTYQPGDWITVQGTYRNADIDAGYDVCLDSRPVLGDPLLTDDILQSTVGFTGQLLR